MREKMVAKLICCFLLSLGCAALFAENLKVKQIVEPKYYDTLVKEGLYSEYRDDGDTIYKLLPKSVYSKQIQDGAVEKAPKGFAFTYEGLYLLNKKEFVCFYHHDRRRNESCQNSLKNGRNDVLFHYA